MKGGFYLAELLGKGARVFRLSPEGDPESTAALGPEEDLPEALADAFLGKKNAPHGVVLALPSSSCFAARLEEESRLRQSPPSAYLYLLEEKLPLPAETLAAEFDRSGGEVFACATLVSPLKEVIAALERRGIRIDHVVPSALLIAWAEGESDTRFVIRREGETDLVELEGGRAREWRHRKYELVAEDDLFLRAASGDEDSPVLEISPKDAERRLLTAARRLLLSRSAPPVDFARSLGLKDPLGRLRPAILFVSLTLAFAALTLSGAYLARSEGYLKRASSSRDELVRIYREVFPSGAIPLSIPRRLESRLLELKGLGGESPGGTPTERASVFPFLVRLLGSFPRGQRFLLLDLRVEEGSAYLSGEARSHGETDLIAASIRQAGFVVDPPRTEKLEEEGVAFVLSVYEKENDAGEEGRP